MPDAEFRRFVHEDAEDSWMQVQVEMTIDMVEGKPGRVEPLKLRADLRAQLRPSILSG